ncbi:holin [Geobacillus phage vB_GthS_PK2.1]|nr:holin [Geobacillus phage vB_GthS_PK2.1]
MKTPQQTDTLFTAIAGGFASTVAYLIGGVDNLTSALAVFMGLDYVTGILSAFYTKQVNSYLAYRGLAKKAGMISFVIVANQLDIVTGNTGGFLRDAMIMFLIGMEGISIKENVEKMGFNAPGFIVEALKKLTGNEKNDPPSKGA